MNPLLMTDSNQTEGPFVWQLPHHDAVTLAAHAGPRALWVHEGRVWLTRRCDACSPDDVWLKAGQSHTLPAGSEWVVEAWPHARVTLVQAAPVRVKPRPSVSWSQAWRAAVQVGRAWV